MADERAQARGVTCAGRPCTRMPSSGAVRGDQGRSAATQGTDS